LSPSIFWSLIASAIN